MTELELAYLAGVADSDGSITIGVDKWAGVGRNRSAPRFFEIIAIRQCDTEAVHLAQELFGGNITIGKPGSLRGRPSHDWYAYNQRACVVIRALLPYLRIKRKQAELVLALRDIKDRGREANTNRGDGRTRVLKPEVLAEYQRLTVAVRSLNDSRHRDPFADRLAVEVVPGALAQ